MSEFLQFFFSGLTVGSVYALVALGFTLIYNASDVVNFAQGEFVMLGGMVTVFASAAGVPLPVAALVAVCVAVAVGLLLYWLDSPGARSVGGFDHHHHDRRLDSHEGGSPGCIRQAIPQAAIVLRRCPDRRAR